MTFWFEIIKSTSDSLLFGSKSLFLFWFITFWLEIVAITSDSWLFCSKSSFPLPIQDFLVRNHCFLFGFRICWFEIIVFSSDSWRFGSKSLPRFAFWWLHRVERISRNKSRFFIMRIRCLWREQWPFKVSKRISRRMRDIFRQRWRQGWLLNLCFYVWSAFGRWLFLS